MRGTRPVTPFNLSSRIQNHPARVRLGDRIFRCSSLHSSAALFSPPPARAARGGERPAEGGVFKDSRAKTRVPISGGTTPPPPPPPPVRRGEGGPHALAYF